MRRREKNKKSVQIVMGLSLCLLLIMTVGYATFSTNLSITARGNIKNILTTEKLKSKAVTSGEGLYTDYYEEGRYVYKGANPDNYIKFNDELWRILSIEKDNTLKIIKNESLGVKHLDPVGARTAGYCSLGDAPIHGCNAWQQGIIT